MAKADLTFARLREVLEYNPDTGNFTWIKPSGRRVHAGEIAGSPHSEGYINICVDGHRYFAHRLAWFWMTACWPAADMDHRDGKRDNNRIRNLRPATRSQNLHNIFVARSHGVAGLLGVVVDKRRPGKFMARIVVDRMQRHIGTFSSAKEAHAAYVDARRRLHPGCTL